jgi:hypothetical protein
MPGTQDEPARINTDRRRRRCAAAMLGALLLTSGLLAPRAVRADAEADVLAADYAAHLRATMGIRDIRTIHHSKLGPDGMDLVIVSAGFTADEMDTFLEFSVKMKDSLLSLQPWQRFQDWVNIHSVFVEDESPTQTRLRVSGHEGQVLTCDNRIAMDYAMMAADATTAMVLHNSAFSTPACGMWGVVVFNKRDATNPGSPVHELGHGLAGLGDEYIQRSGPFDGTEDGLVNTVNVTAIANPRLCRWHYWTVEEWPGLFGMLTARGSSPVKNFEGAGWPTGIYRPEESCMMRGNRDGFCVVCDETMQANLIRYTNLLSVVEPAQEDLVLWKGESINVRVAGIPFLREPPAWLASRLELYLNGKKVAGSDRAEVSFRIDGNRAPPGVHHLGAQLNVQSQYIRRDFSFLSDNRAWRVRVMPHARPTLIVPSELTAPPTGSVKVPVAIQHRRPNLFALRMEHAPEGAVLENGEFTWNPAGATGSWRVDFIASFDGQDAAVASMILHVAAEGVAAAALEMPAAEPVDVLAGRPVELRLPAPASAAAGRLLFEPVEFPAGATLDRYTGAVTWTPAADQAGPRRLRYRVHAGRAAGEGAVVCRVRRLGKPTPVSYSNSHVPDTLARLTQRRASPLLYARLFEPLRLLRDRLPAIHTPALAAAQAIYEELEPAYRDHVLQDLALHAWAFTDKPAVRDWMRTIAESAATPGGRLVNRQLERMDAVAKIKQLELEGDAAQVVPLANAIARNEDPVIRAALDMALRAVVGRMPDDAARRQALLAALAQTRGPIRAALVPMIPLENTPEVTAAMTALSRDADRDVARAAREALEYFAGLGTTGGFFTAWHLAGPYTAPEGGSVFDTPFAPEQDDAGVEWKPIRLEANAGGAYIADLARLIGGDQRAAYLKTTLHSAREQEVLLAAGSDDGIKIWLNGDLIHARNAQRGVKPGEDRVRGRLKAGENTVLCKIVQYHLGWGACLSVHSTTGGPALGVTVPAQAAPRP